MNLKYQNILILNGVLGVTAQNRLYCRKSSWFVRGAFRPRGSSTTTTDRRVMRISYDMGTFITERLANK